MIKGQFQNFTAIKHILYHVDNTYTTELYATVRKNQVIKLVYMDRHREYPAQWNSLWEAERSHLYVGYKNI